MKIAIITHQVRKGDGQGLVNYQIIKKLTERGHEIFLIASDIAKDIIKIPDVTCYKINISKKLPILIYDFLFAYKSNRIVKIFESLWDIIIVNGASSWCKSDYNIVHFVHSSWFKSEYYPYRNPKNIKSLYQYCYTRINCFLEKKCFSRTGTIIGVSERIKNELIDLNIDESQIKVIHNGVDINEYFPLNIKKYQNSEITGMFIGDLQTSRKNLDSVIKALIKTEKINLLVIGEIGRSLYPDLVQREKLSERIKFLGHQKNVSKILQEVDFLVCPSLYEPFSLVLIEAMATEIPVITSKNVGASILIDQKSGIVINSPKDITALHNAMCKIKDPDVRKQMGQNARKVAVLNSWDKVAVKYEKLIISGIQNGKN